MLTFCPKGWIGRLNHGVFSPWVGVWDILGTPGSARATVTVVYLPPFQGAAQPIVVQS